MIEKLPAVILAIAALPGAAQELANLGVNPDSGLAEIRIRIPGLAADAAPLEMVLIPSGTYLMGSPVHERGRQNWMNEDQHEEIISTEFYIGIHEITQAQWQAVMGENPAAGRGEGANHPVYAVAWNGCMDFVERMNAMGIGTFRLPREAEWEYACRAGAGTRFSFGDALECEDDRAEFCEIADRYMWWSGNSTHAGNPDGAKPVGLKVPNPWGLHDMHGNVWEWCADNELATRQDPYDLYPFRVIRGGRLGDYAKACRSANRSGHEQEGWLYTIGLRLVRDVGEVSVERNWKQYR